jgi:putative hydrolase of the HAD superfamily
MKNVRTVFFDAGQTLLSANPPVERVYQTVFAEHGVNVSEEEIHRAVHATWKEVDARRERGEERWGGADGEFGFWRRFVQAVFQHVGGGALPGALLVRLIEHFKDDRHWTVYPEVCEVLAELSGAGVKLLVISNWDSSLPRLLERLDLLPFFDDVIVSATFGASKPARAIFDEAVRRAGVTHGEALHVGDSLEEDYLGARAAGLDALLVDRAGRAPEGIETICSLSELPSRVLAR